MDEIEIYSSAEEAIIGVLTDINAFGKTSSPRGRETKELIGHTFVIEDPTHRFIGLKSRDLNLYYAIGNTLWVLGQSNDLEQILYYNPRGSMFSDDGKILRGAYGKRIFDMDGVNQWHQTLRELRLDPDSRRAIINIHMPQHDWSGSLDTPCTSDFQFLIRDGQLHMLNHMRSQSAAMVMPYDLFLMTMLHEIAAKELGLELGYYQQFSNSIHYYLNEDKMVNAIMSADDGTISMRPMPKETNYNYIKPLLEFERYARKTALTNKVDIGDLLENLYKLNLKPFWHEIGCILIAKALEYTNHKAYKDFIKTFENSPYESFFINKYLN